MYKNNIELKSIHDNREKKLINFFYCANILYCLIYFTLPIEHKFKELFIGFLSLCLLLSIASFFVPYKNLKKYLFSYSIIFSLLIVYSKLTFTYPNGTSPNSVFIELVFTFTVIYVFGLGKALVFPLIFVCSTIFKIYLFQDVSEISWEREFTSMLRNSLFFIFTLVYVLIYVSYIEKTRVILKMMFTDNYNLLEQKKGNLESINIRLIHTFDQIEKLAHQNSHNMRAPLARIKGISTLLEQLDEDMDMHESMTNEIRKSFTEIHNEIESFKESLSAISIDKGLLTDKHISKKIDS
jgi:signal transduction histidine kinase